MKSIPNKFLAVFSIALLAVGALTLVPACDDDSVQSETLPLHSVAVLDSDPEPQLVWENFVAKSCEPGATILHRVRIGARPCNESCDYIIADGPGCSPCPDTDQEVTL